MTVLSIVGWLATLAVIAAYFMSGRRGSRFYAKANVVLCVPVALPALVAGAYSTAVLSLTFGVIGLYLLVKGKKCE